VTLTFVICLCSIGSTCLKYSKIPLEREKIRQERMRRRDSDESRKEKKKKKKYDDDEESNF
jgi:hypothetical protein